MTRNRWIIFALVCVAILGGLIFISTRNRIDVSELKEMSVIGSTEKLRIGDRVQGSDSQKVTIIEYGDFQCPGCGSLHTPFKALLEKYKDTTTFVFRNFPLTNIHPNALAAAAVAEAAGQQNKYFEMHDKLYTTQDNWSNLSGSERTSYFRKLAEELQLDLAKFDTDLTSDDVSTKIRRDQALGGKSRVDSTPSIIINGQKLGKDALADITKIEEAIKKAITDSGQALPANS